jgi:tripartite-type tricarboxylate transporter receptor subunit TctC
MKVRTVFSLLHIAVASIFLMSSAQAIAAEQFPTKPVKILIGFSPGGSNDVVARLIAPKLAEGLGQPVLIENRPGAGGNIAASAMLASPADGHTLLMCTTGTLSIQPHVLKSMPFDSEKDIVPVTQVISAPYVLLVNSALPVKSVKELIAYAKQKPGEVNFASSGIGTGGHLVGEMLKARAGIDIVHIAYKGTGQALADLLAGQVSMIFDQPVSSMQYARSGRLRALAVASPRRLAAFPEIPTMIEAGVPDFDPVTWNGICAPKNTSPAVVERIQREMAKVLATPEIAKRLAADGMEPVGSTAEQFRAFLAVDRRKWGQLVKEAHVQAE